MCITSLLQLHITTECTVRDFLLCSTLLSPYLHKKQLIPETRVIFCWVFFLNQAEMTLLALEHNAFLKTLNIDIVWLSMILTAKISSYMRTTFSFKGFLEDDVLLSSPAFFSTWDMIKSEKITTVKRHIYLMSICLLFSAAPFRADYLLPSLCIPSFFLRQTNSLHVLLHYIHELFLCSSFFPTW